MRTVRTKIFKFTELSEQSQATAIENWPIETDHIYDEAYSTVKAFNEIFNVEKGRKSWLEYNIDHIDSEVLELKGLRLRKYIINNFWSSLYKGKYFSLWSKTEKSYKHYPQGYPVLKSRYSNVMFDNTCTLTGIAYDMEMLQPIYNLIQYKDKPDYYSYLDYETLISDCFASLETALEKEVDFLNSSEYKETEILASDTEFTKDGLIFHK